MAKICEGCGKEYSPDRRVQKFCSQACYRTFAVGPHNHSWRGGRSVGRHRYIRINIGRGERQDEHVVKAEKALGRPLKPNECVHHLNMNKTDNRNSNLLICTRGYHTWLHFEMSRRYAQEHFA